MKKITALSLSVLSLGLGFMTNSFAISRSSDEERVAKTHQQEILKHKTKSTRHKIKQLKAEFERNESKIKRLEAKRLELDHDLAVVFQLKENKSGCFENRRLQKETYKITVKVDLNKEKIKKLKKKRKDLEHELAILFHLQETSNSYDF